MNCKWIVECCGYPYNCAACRLGKGKENHFEPRKEK